MEENGSKTGFFRMMRSIVAAPFEERVAREEFARMEAAQARTAMAFLDESVRLVQPERDGYVLIGGGTDRKLDAETSQALRTQATRARYRSPLMKGYLNSLSAFVIGQGPTIKVETEDEELDKRANDWLDQFRMINQWDKREDELFDRTIRDGETFLRKFVQKKDGEVPIKLTDKQQNRLTQLQVSVGELKSTLSAPRGMVLIRLLAPEHIRDPIGVFEDGIVTSAEDAGIVLGYIYAPDEADKQKTEFIPADEMMHTPIEVDSDVLRGRSLLEVLLEPNKKYEDWLGYRMALNMARSALFLFKKITGTPAQGEAIRDAAETTKEDPINDRRLKMLKPMTVVHHGPGIEYDLQSPNMQAQDAQHDGKSLLLFMAAGAGLPDYMFTADASGSNYASSLVAEGPAFRTFKDWQDTFTPVFETPHRWALVEGAKAGQIRGLTAKKAETINISVEWPKISVREELAHTQRNAILNAEGILSKEGWSIDEGVDHKTEKVRTAKEQEEKLDFVGTANPNAFTGQGTEEE